MSVSSSDTLGNYEEKEKILYKSKIKKKFPYNPIEVFKSFNSLKKPQIIKLSLSAIIIILFAIFNNVQITGNPQPVNKCYFDEVHKWTNPINYYYRGNDGFRIFFQISATLSLDIVFIYSLYSWAIYGVDWRLGISVMLFYGIRYIMNELARLNYPELFYFPNPGFPAIVTSYIEGSDFFYSGHSGFPIINMMEFIWMKKYWFAAFCAYVSFVEVFMVIITRNHFTIDVIVGVSFAHYISIQGRYYVKFIYDKIEFLKKLKDKNRKELKRIKLDWDIGD
jgi:hypothetical protein